MRHYLLKTIAIILTIYLVSGCEKNVDIDIDEIDQMIVLNGLLQADSIADIYLSRTRHILDNKEIESLRGAEVEIVDEDGTAWPLDFNGHIYQNHELVIEEGGQYTVRASADGFTEVEAVCTIPEAISIISVDTTSNVNEWGEKQIEFEVAFKDPSDEVNYYMLTLSARVMVKHFEITERYDTLYVDEANDTVIMGYVYDTLEYIIPRYDPLWIESEDPAVEQLDYFNNRVIFTDRYFDGRSYTFNGKFYDWFLYDAGDTSTVYFILQSVDEHYFKYINTREDHYYAKNDPFAVPVVVHSNIENGVGILGGIAADVDSVLYAPRSYIWDDFRFD